MQIVESVTKAGELIGGFNNYFGFSTERDISKIDDKNRLKFRYKIYSANGGNPVAVLWGAAP